jgi:hypothetical protein
MSASIQLRVLGDSCIGLAYGNKQNKCNEIHWNTLKYTEIHWWIHWNTLKYNDEYIEIHWWIHWNTLNTLNTLNTPKYTHEMKYTEMKWNEMKWNDWLMGGVLGDTIADGGERCAPFFERKASEGNASRVSKYLKGYFPLRAVRNPFIWAHSFICPSDRWGAKLTIIHYCRSEEGQI